MLRLGVWKSRTGACACTVPCLLVAWSVYRSVCGSRAVGVCLEPSSELQAALLRHWRQLPGWTLE
jgi:hypothetical protein